MLTSGSSHGGFTSLTWRVPQLSAVTGGRPGGAAARGGLLGRAGGGTPGALGLGSRGVGAAGVVVGRSLRSGGADDRAVSVGAARQRCRRSVGTGQAVGAGRVAARRVLDGTRAVAGRRTAAVLHLGDTVVVDHDGPRRTRTGHARAVAGAAGVRAVERSVGAHSRQELQRQVLAEVQVAGQQSVGGDAVRAVGVTGQHGVHQVVTEVVLRAVVVRLVRTVAGGLQDTDVLGSVAVAGGRADAAAGLVGVLLELEFLGRRHLLEAGLVLGSVVASVGGAGRHERRERQKSGRRNDDALEPTVHVVSLRREECPHLYSPLR